MYYVHVVFLKFHLDNGDITYRAAKICGLDRKLIYNSYMAFQTPGLYEENKIAKADHLGAYLNIHWYHSALFVVIYNPHEYENDSLR